MIDLPLTIIAGYLGSGKTTYINQWLSTANGVRYAVLVNDFGELNIDAQLIDSTSARSIRLTNGCVCCSISNDLDAALADIDTMAESIDWVLMEASGVADPDKVSSQIRNAPGFELNETITLVDVTRIQKLVNDKYVGRHIQKQLQQAAKIVLSKSDLVDEKALAAIELWLEGFAASAPQLKQPYGLSFEPHPKFYSKTISSDEPIDRQKLDGWLTAMDDSVLRIKGFVLLACDPGQRYLLQWVDRHWSLEPHSAWSGQPRNNLVLICSNRESVVFNGQNELF